MLQTLDPKPNANAVQIRYLNPDGVTDPSLVQQLRSWLDRDEQARLARFVRPVDQHQFLVSHALLRRLLSQSLGCTPQEIAFGTTGRQKPILTHPRPDKALHFNLSHTRGMTVVAMSDSPLGVDTEWLDRQAPAENLAARYFTPTEVSDIQNQAPTHIQRRFLSYWTLKEAFLKAEGWGIVESLDGFEFELSAHPQWPPPRIRLRVRHALSFPTRPWRFYQWHLKPDHLVSLAVCAHATQSAPPDIRAWHDNDWAR
jgi:4'-phosphopantetheinyl transferase